MIVFILNLPYTLIGLIVGIFSIPTSFSWINKPFTMAIHVRKLWWTVGYLRGARAVTIGQVILLGPETESGDLAHELIHVQQYQREPLIHPFLYLLELIKKGYKNNKYEVEAYALAGNSYKTQ